MSDGPAAVYAVGKPDEGKRLDLFLQERIPKLSRTRIQKAIKERTTLSWGVRARPSTPVRAGGEIRIAYRELNETPLDITIPILARGEGWLCVDKPPGIPVHPVARVLENSVIRLLRRQLGDEDLNLCHRLDAETSGALLVADNSETARHFSRAFFHDRVHKEYVAWVRGAVEADAGEINLPIGDATESAIHVRLVAKEGMEKPARTRWQVEERVGDRSRLRLFPESGRRHQLRVHLEAIGHPILGDPMYGHPDAHYLAMVAGEDPRRLAPPRRMLLHCAKMTLPNPSGGNDLHVTAPLPVAFEDPLEPSWPTNSPNTDPTPR